MKPTAEIISESGDEVVIQVTVRKSTCFAGCEDIIQEALCEAGRLACGSCLSDFDTDGTPILRDGRKLTAKRRKVPKTYGTRWGKVSVGRYVYQDSGGGSCLVPLEERAGIVGASTPGLARVTSFLYANGNAGFVASALDQALGSSVSRCYVQDVSGLVAGDIEEAAADASRPGADDHLWDGGPPPQEVAAVAVGIDGTCLLMCEGGYRQVMVGTIALYDAAGDRLDTRYVAAAPEEGRGTFLERMDGDIDRTRRLYPDARYVGVTDGARDFRPWLEEHTTTQVLDFWHVAEHLGAASHALGLGEEGRAAWMADTCHELKHGHGAAARILAELDAVDEATVPAAHLEALRSTRTYLRGNLDRTNYASYRKSHIPIGSGVTEAACKTLVKTRMCGSGMRWRERGADTVLVLRSLAAGGTAWDAYWRRRAAAAGR